MHPGQVELGVDTAARLVADQFPQWADLPVRAVASHGTVNALFRLGDDYVLRFPLLVTQDGWADLVAEQNHARRLAAQVPVAVPEPIALGGPGAGYPGPWSVYRWIPGVSSDALDIGGSNAFTDDLAGFVRALHRIGTAGRRWNGTGRGGPLGDADAEVRASLAASRGLVDVDAVTNRWDSCLTVPRGAGRDVWIHADLMPGNLVVRDGRLVAVIDLGAVGIGDPAVDLLPAWTLLSARTRDRYRRTLQVDDAQWERGRGWAIVQAAMALPYYVDTNPTMALIARRTLAAVIERSSL